MIFEMIQLTQQKLKTPLETQVNKGKGAIHHRRLNYYPQEIHLPVAFILGGKVWV